MAERPEKLEFPRYHDSHSIVYGEVVYCMFCRATREQLYEPCPNAVDIEALRAFARKLEEERR